MSMGLSTSIAAIRKGRKTLFSNGGWNYDVTTDLKESKKNRHLRSTGAGSRQKVLFSFIPRLPSSPMHEHERNLHRIPNQIRHRRPIGRVDQASCRPGR